MYLTCIDIKDKNLKRIEIDDNAIKYDRIFISVREKICIDFNDKNLKRIETDDVVGGVVVVGRTN